MSSNYTDLNLNQYLQPDNAPVSDPRNYLTAYDLQSTGEQNLISNFLLQNFTFNKAQGGTLTLGGVGNGNGVLNIKDSGGTNRITGNNAGITITNGNIVIQNTSAGTVLDSLGVTNTTLITQSAITTGGGFGQTFSGTADTPFTGGTITFNLQRTSTCLSLFTISQYGGSGTTSFLSTCSLKVDGNLICSTVDRIQNSQFQQTSAAHSMNSFSSGNHTLIVSGRTDVSGGTSTIYLYQLTYILLGQ